MLVVRKEGKEHARYNSFRSAFELLESVGRDPQDCFDERHEDLPPLQKLQQTQARMQQQIEQLQTSHQQQIASHQQQIEQLQTKQQTQAQQIAKLMLENELLRSTVNDVLK